MTAPRLGATFNPITWLPGWIGDPILSLGGAEPSGEDIILVPYSYPETWFVPSRPLDQKELEFWQLGQMTADYFTATGEHIAPLGIRTSEHPDFEIVNIEAANSLRGVELAEYVPGPRLAVEKAMREVRGAIATDLAPFGHLRGCRIWIAFDGIFEPKDVARITRRLGSAVLDGLRDLSAPSIELSSLATNGPPQSFPPEAFSTIDCDGFTLSAQRPGGSVASSSPPAVSPTISIKHTRDEVQGELVRVVNAHNYLGIDLLIVPIAGPSEMGALCGEGGMLMHFLMSEAPDTSAWFAERSGRVVLHNWKDGSVTQVFPERQVLSPAIDGRIRRKTLVGYDDNGHLKMFW